MLRSGHCQRCPRTQPMFPNFCSASRSKASLYVPWKCEHERHAYELCEYKDYKRRVALAQQGA